MIIEAYNMNLKVKMVTVKGMLRAIVFLQLMWMAMMKMNLSWCEVDQTNIREPLLLQAGSKVLVCRQQIEL